LIFLQSLTSFPFIKFFFIGLDTCFIKGLVDHIA
jgi:hypothetical protein